jgi:argininosuccinate lyase
MSAQVAGAFNAALIAMQSKPFTNLVSVNTEGTRPVWEALRQARNGFHFFRSVIREASPRKERMRDWAAENYVAAISIVEEVLKGGRISFREAHHRIGALVREAAERGISRLETLGKDEETDDEIRAAIQAGGVRGSARNEYGGGGGEHTLEKQFGELTEQNRDQRRSIVSLWKRWHESQKALTRAAHDKAYGGAKLSTEQQNQTNERRRQR